VAFASRSSFDRSAASARGRSGRGRDREPPDADVPPEPDADPESVARQICLHLLEHAPRTRAELAAKLKKRGVPDDAAQAVLGRFAEVGLIDDALFADMWVTSRHRAKGLAGRALQQELRRKGVDDDTAAEAVASIDSEQERVTARALVDRKLASTRGLAVDARVRRLAGMLARKGYSGGVAFAVVREALAEEGELVPALDTDGLSALD
jgi:regulatory protein